MSVGSAPMPKTKFVVFVAFRGEDVADTIVIGPYQSYKRATETADDIQNYHGDERCATMVTELTPCTRIGFLFEPRGVVPCPT